MNWPTDNNGIIAMILQHEGGYINLSNDKGGPTNMGVTIDQLASFRKSQVTASDIKNLSVQEASALYLQKFIVGPNFDQVSDVKLRAALVDFGVLFGPARAIQALQAILGGKVDGILGPSTIQATQCFKSAVSIINQLSAARISRHVDRVTVDPTQLQFLKGWVNRALSFVE